MAAAKRRALILHPHTHTRTPNARARSPQTRPRLRGAAGVAWQSHSLQVRMLQRKCGVWRRTAMGQNR